MAKQKHGEMSFLQHLEVLRWHLVRSSIAILIGATVAFFNKHILFDIIIFGPKSPDFITYKLFCEITGRFAREGLFCLTEMPFEVLNTRMAGQFNTHIMVSLMAGFILAFPYVLWEVWRFIKPGLHSSEKQYSRWILFFASILFMTGVLFGYYLIAPLSVQFLGTYTVSGEVNNLIDLVSYIGTVSTVTFAAGIIFELPIIVYFLAKIGLITPEGMRTYRKHAIVVILVVSAVITPPDITSQILVGLPLIGLYQISIAICKRVIRNQRKRELAGYP